MADVSENMLRLLMDQIRENSDKLDEMKESYYKLRAAVDSHQVMDERIHKEICEFIESANKRLDEYNRQLEIHITATMENREDIAQFKKTIEPMLKDFVEDRAVKRANLRMLKKIGVISGTITGVIAAATAVMKLLDLV